MDRYIRDFEMKTIETKIADDIIECNYILEQTAVSNLRIYHSNIRSIVKNIDELKITLHEFKTKFDLIVLTESWNLTDLTILNISGYDIIYNNSILNKNDGVVIFINSSLNYIHEIINIGITKAISLKISYNSKTIHVSSLYRLPSTCPYAFNQDMDNYLKSIKNDKADIKIFLGDININILDNNDYSEEYLNILAENGYISTINTYTREQRNSKSCIDHLFLKTEISLELFTPIVLHSCISDHYPIILQINAMSETEKNVVQYNNKYKFYLNKVKLFNEFKKESWDPIYIDNDIDNMTNSFISKLKQIVDKCTDKKIIRKQELKRKDWITNGLIKSVNKKNQLYKKMKKYPNNEQLKNEFITYRNTLDILIKTTKVNYYKQKINNIENSPGKIWTCLKNINGHKQEIREIKQIKNNTGNLTSDKIEMAEVFATHYTTLGKKLASKISADPNFKSKTTKILNSIYLQETNESEIKEIIATLKSGKSPGLDTLKTETLQEIANFIAEPLAFIINRSLEVGIFPTPLKNALIKPIYKNGDKTEPENYRPISLISNLAKIYEKLLKKRIISYLDKNKIISARQYGFREARSTEDAMAELTANIYKSLDESKPCLCIFVDLAKAFDTVNHKKLLNTLESIGFRGTALKLMTSYLTNRSQCVGIGNIVSSNKIMEYGVPQGTVLGPLLFNIYVNDLFNVDTEGEVISFADDTVVFYKDSSWANLKKKVELDFINLIKWLNSRLLTINFKKTFFMPFSCYSDKLPTFDNLEFTVDNNQIIVHKKMHIKYLGLIIDSHLRWNYHAEFVVKKLRSMLNKFKFYKQIFDIQQLRILYYSLVQTHLTYGLIAWGGITNNHLKSLQCVQKWILKIIYNKNYRYESEAIFNDANVLDVRQLYFQTLILNHFKLKNILKPIDHKYETRFKSKTTFIQKTEKTIGQRCHTYLGPVTQAEIPEFLRNINSISLLKKKLKQWLSNTPRKKIHQLIDRKNNYNY